MVKTVEATDVHARMQAGEDFMLLDCRETDEVAIANVQGAVNIPMSTIETRLDELDKSADIVVMCHHGVRSMNVGNFLVASGFSNISSMSGGIHAWSQTVDGDVPTY